MTCTKCGTCCRYLAFTISKDIRQIHLLNRLPQIIIGVDLKITDDVIAYYNLRGVRIITDKGTPYLVIPNDHPERNIIEPIGRNKYRLVVYIPCSKLKDNLCSIWETKPKFCSYKDCELTIWRPSCCKD